MESVQDLRARIAKIATEIDLQKELLKKLERDKSLVQRQPNAVLDPVARLPLEISSEIFLRSLGPWRSELEDPFPMPGTRNSLILLLNICNAWTDIALSISALWAAIHIIFPCPQGLKENLPIWLERAGNHPLTVSLNGELDQDGLAIIWKHSQQLQHLEICAAEEEDGTVYDEDIDDDDEVMDLWGRTGPGPLPLLETVKIRGAYRGIRTFSGSHLFELLRLAPNLTECTFHRVQLTDFDDDLEDLVFPRLRRLMFGERGTHLDNQVHILEHLSLPALEILSLSLFSSSSSFAFFLRRSLPPLRELVLGGLVLGSGIYSNELVECMHLMPTLTRLETWRPQLRVLEQLFVALTECPSLLPNLRTMVIHISTELSYISVSFWATLTRALTARSTQLQVIHVVLPDESPRRFRTPPVSQIPTLDISATLFDLGMAGMQVFVGRKLPGSMNTMQVIVGSILHRTYVRFDCN